MRGKQKIVQGRGPCNIVCYFDVCRASEPVPSLNYGIIKWNIKQYSPLRRKQSIIQNITCVSFMCQWILQYSRARKRRSNDSNSQNPEMLLWVFLCRKGFYCVFCGVVALIQYFSQAFCQIEYLTVSGSQLNWLKKSLLDFVTIGKAFNTCLNKECWGDAFCIPGLPFHLHHLQN